MVISLKERAGDSGSPLALFFRPAVPVRPPRTNLATFFASRSLGLVYNGAMSFPDPLTPSPSAGGGSFAATHWSLVVAARDRAAPQAAEALAELCRAYW